MAHELGHVKNYDIRVSMVVFGLVIAISILADIFLRMSIFSRRDKDTPPIMALLSVVAMLLAPFVAAIVQAAISRRREFLADATGAMTTRYPEGLASALEKIKLGSSATKRQHTASAHLFFANPMRGKNLSTMFSTHPPIDERIARLREMGGKV
jgi:heat shock protein HtpX